MQATKSIDVNLLDLSVVPIVNAKQNDRSSRFVAFQLAMGSAPFTVPTGVSGMFRYKKPDGTGGFYDTNEAGQPAIVISGSTVTVELVEQVLTVPGTVKAELNLYDAAGSKLTSFTIDIIVQESVLTDATIVSSDYYNVLSAQIASAIAAEQNAAASAAAAAQSAADAAATLAGAMAKSVYDPAGGAKQVAFADSVYTKAQADAAFLAKTALLDLSHPIGSIYTSTAATEPSTLFGGTWQRIKDTFLLAAGETYAAGTSGGEATHALTGPEGPAHNHPIGGYATSVGSGDVYYATVQAPAQYGEGYTSEAGGGQPHNNMPPYLTVYVWKRTA